MVFRQCLPPDHALTKESLLPGKFQEAAHAAAAQVRDFTDRSARGDHILWLHPGKPPATANSQLMSLVHALQVRVLPRAAAPGAMLRLPFPERGK